MTSILLIPAGCSPLPQLELTLSPLCLYPALGTDTPSPWLLLSQLGPRGMAQHCLGKAAVLPQRDVIHLSQKGCDFPAPGACDPPVLGGCDPPLSSQCPPRAPTWHLRDNWGLQCIVLLAQVLQPCQHPPPMGEVHVPPASKDSIRQSCSC